MKFANFEIYFHLLIRSEHFDSSNDVRSHVLHMVNTFEAQFSASNCCFKVLSIDLTYLLTYLLH